MSHYINDHFTPFPMLNLFNIRLLASFVLFPITVFAQQPLTADLPFFQKKVLVYQRWLDTTGLSKILKTDWVRLKDQDDTQLEFGLLLKTQNPDTAASLWMQAKRDFDRVTGRPLLPELFNVFIEKMEIPAAQGNVQIYFKDQNGRYSDCFYAAVWSEGGKTKTDEQPDDCRSQRITLQVPPVQVTQRARNGKTITAQRTLTSQALYDTICKLAHELYPPNKYPDISECAGRYPVVTCKVTDEGCFQIIISDLCKEVLTESDVSTWCKKARAVGWDRTC